MPKVVHTPAAPPNADQLKMLRGVRNSMALNRIEALLEREERTQAREQLTELRTRQVELSDTQRTAWKALAERLNQPLPVHRRPRKTFATQPDIRRWAAEFRWEEALRHSQLLLDDAEAPQRAALQAFVAELNDQHARFQKAELAIEQLASVDPLEVQTARHVLWQASEFARPLLLQATQQADPAQVAAALDLLRKRNEPQVATQAALQILRRKDQEDCWPAALELLRMNPQPGTGEPLLALALSPTTTTQRATALEGLAASIDPPENVVKVLLPWLFQDGPELVPALKAATTAASVHHQQEVWTGRSLVDLTEEEQQQLLRLPARLHQLIGEKVIEPKTPVEQAAWHFSAVLGLRESPVLNPVRVLSCSGQLPPHPVTAVLDGIWHHSTKEVGTLWRDSSTNRPWVVFDLGQPRTITGVRIWNYNHPSLQRYGWRETDIFVSNTPSPPFPIATGFIPQGPGPEDPPDFSTIITFPPVTGRYVKLAARSLWSGENQSGLAEVQLLGF